MRDFVDDSSMETRFKEALLYGAGTEGKRIRALLVYATAETLGIPIERVDHPATAIELIHTYSLIHDDLPAMDDDDLRRGKPTVHKQFDDATGILVGDALLTVAFEILASAPVEPELVVRWLRVLTQAAGAKGMIQGQATDLEGERRTLTLAELETMHRQKTGALISASLILAGSVQADDETLQRLSKFGGHIGLAFQIKDDLLDVEGDTEKLGKPQGSDEGNNKSTFVSLLGVQGAKERLSAELSEAQSALDVFDNTADGLRWLADYIVNRDY